MRERTWLQLLQALVGRPQRTVQHLQVLPLGLLMAGPRILLRTMPPHQTVVLDRRRRRPRRVAMSEEEERQEHEQMAENWIGCWIYEGFRGW